MSNEDKIESRQGWVVASINDLIASDGLFVDGDWIESKDQDPYGDVRLIQLADIGDGFFRNKSQRFLDKTTAMRLNCTFLEYNDILVARMPEPLGRACLFPLKNKNSNVTAVDVAIIRPGNISVDAAFLMQAINYQQTRNKILKLQSGTTRKRISRSNLATIDISFPPLPEQRRIVAKIEELFSELEKGVELLNTLKQQLEGYRQAVLKAAFEGKLTEEWRRNHPKLSASQSFFDNLGKPWTAMPELQLPNGWLFVKSGDLFEFVTSGSRGWAKYYSDSGAIFLRISNLDFDSLELDLNDNNVQYVNPPTGSEGSRTRIVEGDFLFSITGYLGMFAIAPKLKEAYVNQHIALCRPIQGFNKKYVGYWIISKSGGHLHLNLLQKGATKAGLGLDDIRNFPIPMCSAEEQNQIVQEIESRLSIAEQIEETVEHTLKQSEILRHSIIKKAFEGRLLSESELEEARKEPDWEPASVLLEKIKNQKVSADTLMQPAKRSVRKGKEHE